MQILNQNNQMAFGIKLKSSKPLTSELISTVKSSKLINDIAKKYPEAELRFKDFRGENFSKTSRGVLLEFDLGTGSKFALTGNPSQKMDALSSLKGKLATYSLENIENSMLDMMV